MKTVSINTYKAFLDEVKLEAEANSWVTERDVTDAGLRELILRSPNDAIVGFKEYSDGTTYYNILLNYATSYDPTKTFWNQPGTAFNYPDNTSDNIFKAPTMLLHDNSMNLFIFVNVNRIVVVVNALSKYVSLYAGRYLRNGTAGQLPNNLFIGSCLNSSNQSLPLSTDNISAFYNVKLNYESASVFKDETSQNILLSGGTVSEESGTTHPFNFFYGVFNIRDLDNNIVLYPTLLAARKKNLGELDGIFFLSSIQGVTPENELTRVVDGITYTYKVFIDGNLVTPSKSFFAVEI